MTEEAFSEHALCDGGCCMLKSTCVRYMGNIDLESKIYNPYVVFNIKPWPGQLCPYYMIEDNGHYPQNRH